MCVRELKGFYTGWRARWMRALSRPTSLITVLTIISKLPGQPDISGSMVLSLAAARVLDGLSHD